MSLQMFTSHADRTEGCVCRADIQIFVIKQLHRGSAGLLVTRLQDRPLEIRLWTKSDKNWCVHGTRDDVWIAPSECQTGFESVGFRSIETDWGGFYIRDSIPTYLKRIKHHVASICLSRSDMYTGISIFAQYQPIEVSSNCSLH